MVLFVRRVPAAMREELSSIPVCLLEITAKQISPRFFVCLSISQLLRSSFAVVTGLESGLPTSLGLIPSRGKRLVLVCSVYSLTRVVATGA